MRRLSAIGPTVIAACLSLAVAGCCCCGDGYTLHGNWSLRLNPCAGSPNACCDSAGNCAGPGCCDEQYPGAQCANPDCIDGRCPLEQPGGRYGGQGDSPASPEAAVEQVRRKLCGLKGRKAAAQVAVVPGPTGPSQGHPRFHPVPVRPVFGPVIVPQPFVPVPVTNPFGDDPEEVPAPAPDGPNARRRAPVKRNPVRTVSAYDNYSRRNAL